MTAPQTGMTSEEPLFRQRIRAAYDQFSPSYRRVADFLLDDYRTAAFLNASGLAQRLSVDPATIVRFAQRLGYPGYPEMAKEIQAAVKRELTAAFTHVQDGQEGDALRQILGSIAEDVERLLVVNVADLLRLLMDTIVHARRVYLLANHATVDTATIFCAQLRLATVQSLVVSGDRTQRGLALLGADASDVAIALALDPADSEVIVSLQAVKQQGLRTFAIVQSHSSPAARAADHIILAPQSGSHQPPTQYITAMALLGGVAQVVASKKREQVSANREELAAWLDRLAPSAAASEAP